MKKKVKIIITIIIVAFLCTFFCLYNNWQDKDTLVSKNESYTVTLEKNNCSITTDNNVATIEKYNGSADTIIVDKEALAANDIAINPKAFLECSNLDTILIDKTIASNTVDIENFKINDEYESDKYVEYKNIQEFSEAYQQYLKLSEEEKNNLEIIPDKYDISMSVIDTQSMKENYNLGEIETSEIPEKFDLRDKINIKVENQGSLGICYAYACLTTVFSFST